uniref:Uncharacterized protein n=1 Tax=Rhodosorus marinus TaxID=101924 RepID=A0A6T6NZT0_9RHOD|mmetsp:Transcript_6252/g.8852  ORF Transcript_6252/g.8852 Transcript_6252/m.8852 type:complete len:529 (+) Transcript_6252:220-1806(+)
MANSGGHEGAAVSCISLSPSEDFFVSGSASGVVAIQQVGGEVGALHTLSVHGSLVSALDLGRRDLLFEGDAHGSVCCTRILLNSNDHGGVKAEKKWELKAAHDALDITGISSTDEGRVVASSGKDECVRLWDVETQKQIVKLEGHKGWVKCVAVATSSDAVSCGNLVVSGGRDKTIKLWDTRASEAREVHNLQGHSGWVHAVNLSEGPRSPKIVSCSGDKTVRLWDLNNLKQENVMRGHELRVWSVAINGSGDFAVSGSSDGTLRSWRVAGHSFTEKIVEKGDDAILAVAMTKNGALAVSGYDSGVVRETWLESSVSEAYDASGSATVTPPEDVFEFPELQSVKMDIQKPTPSLHVGQAPRLTVGNEQSRMTGLPTIKSGNDSQSMRVRSMMKLASKPPKPIPEVPQSSMGTSMPDSTTRSGAAGDKDALMSRVREMEVKIEEIENQRLQMENKYIAAVAEVNVKNAKIAEQDRAIHSLEERLRSLDLAVQQGAGERRTVDVDEEVATSALNDRVLSLLSRMDMLLKN